MSAELADGLRAVWPDDSEVRLLRGEGTARDAVRLLNERDAYLATASRLEDECDRLRAEVADREAVIARLQPTWETP